MEEKKCKHNEKHELKRYKLTGKGNLTFTMGDNTTLDRIAHSTGLNMVSQVVNS